MMIKIDKDNKKNIFSKIIEWYRYHFFDSVSTNKENIKLVRKLLKDKYSKKCFSSYCSFYYSFLRDKTPHCYASFKELEHPKVNIKEGDVVFDIGISGDTEMTEKMILLSGINGKIIGIEANPKVLNKIKNNLCEYKNFELYNYALYGYDGIGVFDLGSTPNCDVNCYGRIPDQYFNTENQINVEYITLDTFIEKYNIEKLDFIKIDIECAEVEAIKASEKTLKKFKPNLAISCHHEGYVINIIKYMNSLDLDYDFYLAQMQCFSAENLYWRDYIVYATARK